MSNDAFRAARDAVEALPSHLFDRTHTDEIAENLAPDFDRFAAQHPGVPPQTGGGDAGERAREHASAVLYRVTEHLAKTGEWADEDLDDLRAGLAMLDSRKADLRSSHREGAEAMREACAQFAAGSEYGAIGYLFAERIRALPVPGKTDAG